MKFAICNETYQDWTFQQTCEHIATTGYQGVEIAPFTLHDSPEELTEAQARETGRIAARAGLEVVGFHWLLVKPEGLNLTTENEAVRKRTVAFAQHLSRRCAEMGGKIMVWGSPKQRMVPCGGKYEDAFGRAVDAIRAVSEVAGSVGVTLALEPLAPNETNFLTTAAETQRMIDAVGHPACRLHLDVKAMAGGESQPLDQVIRDHARSLAHFHANDSNRRGPGTGSIDFHPIARALRDANYTGYVSVEVFDYTPDPQTIAVESLRYLRRVFGEG